MFDILVTHRVFVSCPMCLLYFLVLYTLLLLSSTAYNVQASGYPDFSAWDRLVSSNATTPDHDFNGVITTYVDYRQFYNTTDFKETLDVLGSEVDIHNFTKAEFLAYHINAYNILAVSTIVKHACRQDMFGDCSPLESILDIGTVFEPVWNRVAGTVAGRAVTLDEIEYRLRFPGDHGYPEFEPRDPRLHSAIVCASISCPNLRREAYTPHDLDTQLDDAMTQFLNNTSKGLVVDSTLTDVDTKSHCTSVTASHIFGWFAADFETDNRTVLHFMAKYAPKSTRSCLLEDDVVLGFFTYNWDLNGHPLDCMADRVCFGQVDMLVVLGVLCCCCFVCTCALYVHRKQQMARVGPDSEETTPLVL